MKKRISFVSNSSSSSYIVCKPNNISLEDFCGKLAYHCVDTNNIEEKERGKKRLFDIFSTRTLDNTLTKFFSYSNWDLIKNKFPCENPYDGFFEGGKITIELLERYLNSAQKYLENYDDYHVQYIMQQEGILSKGEMSLLYKDIDVDQDNLKKDIEKLKMLIDHIKNKSCELYVFRLSYSGDCEEEDGIYSFDVNSPTDMKKIQQGIDVVLGVEYF